MKLVDEGESASLIACVSVNLVFITKTWFKVLILEHSPSSSRPLELGNVKNPLVHMESEVFQKYVRLRYISNDTLSPRKISMLFYVHSKTWASVI